MLTVTVDNASNNDKMVTELAELILSFPGSTNQVHCFAHILNLIAKMVIHQFDSGKNAQNKDDAAAALAELVTRLEIDDGPVVENDAEATLEDLADIDDDVDGWIDERTDLTEEEWEELQETVLPVKMILAKVCFAYLGRKDLSTPF